MDILMMTVFPTGCGSWGIKSLLSRFPQKTSQDTLKGRDVKLLTIGVAIMVLRGIHAHVISTVIYTT